MKATFRNDCRKDVLYFLNDDRSMFDDLEFGAIVEITVKDEMKKRTGQGIFPARYLWKGGKSVVTVVAEMIYHPFRKERISLQKPTFVC